ncbi:MULTISPECIES: DUF3685 domain-containing protein [Prochlorococcus]|uniref:DUF3685 domain-containing protein n=1 Tax=Prochlorococcus TaxID=1218 RepID=UPI000A9FCE54|nr:MULTISPECIES: DUF3685 domain-containing protein [Prochlorococcus]
MIAPSLLGESLAKQLSSGNPGINVVLSNDLLTRNPSLVIWSIDTIESPENIKIEIKRLSRRWSKSPTLIILPSKFLIPPSNLLELDCQGIVQDPDIATLNSSIQTLLNGGRVIKLTNAFDVSKTKASLNSPILDFLIKSGITDIDKDIAKLNCIKERARSNILNRSIVNARLRELKAAKNLLLWIWGPMPISLSSEIEVDTSKNDYPYNDYDTDITLPNTESTTVRETIFARIRQSLNHELLNKTNTIFASEALISRKQRALYLSLIKQLEKLISKLKGCEYEGDELYTEWNLLQEVLRRQTLRDIADEYSKADYKGNSVIIADQLNDMVSLDASDSELPKPDNMLDTLVLDKPLLVDGQFLPSDHPKALLKIEILISNWLIRTADIVSSELLNTCYEWSALRQYILKHQLISTRELERFRNQLNTQDRINELFKRPVQLYESKRQLYRLNKSSIESFTITEPRDNELDELPWFQKQVTLLVETRDALSPQVQSIVKHIGDLMVVLLTNVLGRAIGLIGKGIAQGMGRTINR